MGQTFEFDRYINGTLMAQGITIERETTLESAMKAAVRLCERRPGQVAVLVLRQPDRGDTGAKPSK